ncbi:ATP-binding cassette domain-containing protein [Streptomyces sp. NPDC010273]|uniref:ATP-binding cassette domain-containing protein n=1 Tax=Streptomyces sp. NPDC010273 TaxID=3364829 RepID=UPI0036E41416
MTGTPPRVAVPPVTVRPSREQSADDDGRGRGPGGGRVDVRELRSYVGHVDPLHPLAEPLRVPDVVLTGLTNSVAPLPRWRPTPDQEARAARLIDTMGLTELSDARRPTLTQGQRGRTLIARALMPEPRLLLLDEPATGLDLPGRERLLDALDSHQVGNCFDLPLVLDRHDGRWSVRIRHRT